MARTYTHLVDWTPASLGHARSSFRFPHHARPSIKFIVRVFLTPTGDNVERREIVHEHVSPAVSKSPSTDSSTPLSRFRVSFSACTLTRVANQRKANELNICKHMWVRHSSLTFESCQEKNDFESEAINLDAVSELCHMGGKINSVTFRNIRAFNSNIRGDAAEASIKAHVTSSCARCPARH